MSPVANVNKRAPASQHSCTASFRGRLRAPHHLSRSSGEYKWTMVLFENITNNQRVEVKHEGETHQGTVKYKGCLNGIKGEWVGIALDKSAGFHDGMVHARRYFFCRPKHGIFTTANNIRFIPMKRCLYNKYRPSIASPEPPIDEVLFGNASLFPAKPMWPDEDEIKITPRPKSAFLRCLEPSPAFPRASKVSKYVPPVLLTRPESARATLNRSLSDIPLHTAYGETSSYFINPPSIPKSHMPYNLLQKQVKKGWERDHYIRHMTVNSGRDSIKLHQWNDIS